MPSKNQLPLFFVRYAPGAAGNFLITLLQSSSKLCHWDPTVESLKNTTLFSDAFKNYFVSKFTSDLVNHLKHEPHHQYQLDFFSAKHPRGDNLTISDFIHELSIRNNDLFLSQINDNKSTVLRLNKSTIPLFGYNSPILNIVIDPLSTKWVYKTRMTKLYSYENEYVISNENHPDFLKFKYQVLHFQNEYRIKMSRYAYLKNCIINENVVKLFKQEKTITADVSNQKSGRQYFLNLSDVLNFETFITKIVDIFDYFELGTPNLELIGFCYNHYYNTNILPILKLK